MLAGARTVDDKTTITIPHTATGTKPASGICVKSHSQPPSTDSTIATL